MTHNDTNDTSVVGNTSTTTIPNIRSRKWCITINNPVINDKKIYFKKLTQRHTFIDYIFGLEKGEEGTPHIQGFVNFKNAITFRSMKKAFPKAHIEKAKGSIKQNFEYCSKDGDFISNIDLRSHQEKIIDEIINDEYKDVQWTPWQKKIFKILDNKPDKRKIHWFWEPNGNIGKSYLCKYLALTRKIIIADGKKTDIFHSIYKLINDQKETPTIIMIDIPRTNFEYVNYGAIEQIKNGCIYSGKYEGGLCVFPIPHVIIFANEEPKYEAMSKDRWDVTQL